MLKQKLFKKIIPSLLIVIILSVGIFGVVGVRVNTVMAQNSVFDTPSDPTTDIVKEFINKDKKDILRVVVDNKLTIEENTKILDNLVKNGVIDQKTKQDILRNKQLSIDYPMDASVYRFPDEINKNFEDFLKEEYGLIKDKNSCHFFAWSIKGCINWGMSVIGQSILSMFALFLGISGYTLDRTVSYTVIEMGSHVKGTNTVAGIGFIVQGWKMFRDLANIIIIFVLLVIGIATILRIEKYGSKKLLATLIAVAILINFSLFFTQIIIDTSNLLATVFYQKITGGGWTGIGYAYMDAFQLTSFYNAKEAFDPQTLTKDLALHQIFLVSMLGSIVFLVATFTFLAGAFLLISRFVMLIFLMVLSPLAFVMMILPKTQSYASKWLGMLFSYSFFAPIYILLSWFVINVVTSDAFKISIGLGNKTALADVAAGGASAIKSIPIILNFILIVIFILASLIIANSLGIRGSKAVMKWGESATKWGRGMVGGATFGMGGRILRTTAGRGASKWADSEKVKDRAASGGIRGIFGKMQLRGLRGVASSSFDVRATKAGAGIGLGKAGGKGGYEAKLKKQVKDNVELAKVIGSESFNERQDRNKLASDIDANEKTLKLIDKEIAEVTTAANSPIESQTKEDAKKKLQEITLEREKLINKIKTIKETKKNFKPGIERQRQYADTIEKQTILGIPGLKVPRKRKEGALDIRKMIKNAPNKSILDKIAKELKTNEEGSSGSKEKSEDK